MLVSALHDLDQVLNPQFLHPVLGNLVLADEAVLVLLDEAALQHLLDLLLSALPQLAVQGLVVDVQRDEHALFDEAALVAAELVEQDLMEPALLLLVGHGEVAHGLVAVLLRLLPVRPRVRSVFGVVDLVLEVGGGRGLILLDPGSGELCHEELEEFVVFGPACADAEDGADLVVLNVGVGLIDMKKGRLILIDLSLQHQMPRKPRDVPIDEYLPLLHHFLDGVMAEVVSIEDGLALGVDQFGIAQELERIADVLMLEVVILVPHLHDLIEVQHFLKVLRNLSTPCLLFCRFWQLLGRRQFFYEVMDLWHSLVGG